MLNRIPILIMRLYFYSFSQTHLFILSTISFVNFFIYIYTVVGFNFMWAVVTSLTLQVLFTSCAFKQRRYKQSPAQFIATSSNLGWLKFINAASISCYRSLFCELKFNFLCKQVHSRWPCRDSIGDVCFESAVSCSESADSCLRISAELVDAVTL